jgi:acyl-CoA synthetase (AMP-forming)/AMP-acid ligase II
MSDFQVPSQLFPYASHRFEVRPGIEMAYIDEGPRDAPPVLLVHGNPTWSFYWRALIEALSPTHRVIVPDHVGCGRSDKPDDDAYAYRLRNRIDDLEALVEHLKLGPLDLGVHDWGGMIGMGWAHRHPEQVKSLLLLNTAAFRLPSTKPLPKRLRAARDFQLGGWLVQGLNAFSLAATRMAVTRRPLPKDIRQALVAPYNSWDNRRAVLRFVQDIPLAPEDPSWQDVVEVEEQLSQFDDRPVLICWGDRDFVFDHHFLRVWREHLPSARVHQFPDCGHYVLEDARGTRQGVLGAPLAGRRSMTAFTNVAAYLTKVAGEKPDAVAMYMPGKRTAQGRQYSEISYRELDQRSEDIALGLQSAGISRGDRVVLMVKPSPELFALTFGLFKAGVVPVMVDPGIGMSRLKACLARAEPTGFIGITAAQAASKVLGWAKDTVKQRVTVGRRLLWGGSTLVQVEAAGAKRRAAGEKPQKTQPEEMAAILFTSGSTGVPKGVVYTHANFLAQVEALEELFAFGENEIDLPTFPLFALFDPALGMTTVIPHMDATKPASVDPREIIEPIERFGVTTMFGSPALLNTVGRYGEEHGLELPTLGRVIAAGAPLPAATMERWHGFLNPEAEIFPPYGATESLPIACISSRQVVAETWAKTEEGKGVCVGTPVPSISVKVVEITDEVVGSMSDLRECEVGEVGEVTVAGPMVTERYFGDAENTAKHKIDDGGQVRHRMGDLGYVDEQGRLWFCGRKSQRVVLGDGRTLFTVPNEKLFDAHPQVFRSALVGVKRGGTTRPVLVVEAESSANTVAAKSKLRDELLELASQHETTRDIQEIHFHPGFPVDIRHNAKIGREELSRWAQEQGA